MTTTPVLNLNPNNPQPAPLTSPAWNAVQGVTFPASMRELVVFARERGADNDTLAIIAGIPDRTYTTPRELAAALGVDDNVEGKSAIWSPAGSQELEGEGTAQKKSG